MRQYNKIMFCNAELYQRMCRFLEAACSPTLKIQNLTPQLSPGKSAPEQQLHDERQRD